MARPRRRRRAARTPPIHVWHEPIDAAMGAAIAHCEATEHGWFRALTTFLLIEAGRLPPEDWSARWQVEARAHLTRKLNTTHGGSLPFVRPAWEVPHETHATKIKNEAEAEAEA